MSSRRDRLGRIAAGSGTRPWAEVTREYAAVFARTLATPPDTGAHVNVLQHLAGHLRDRVDACERAALQAGITIMVPRSCRVAG